MLIKLPSGQCVNPSHIVRVFHRPPEMVQNNIYIKSSIMIELSTGSFCIGVEIDDDDNYEALLESLLKHLEDRKYEY